MCESIGSDLQSPDREKSTWRGQIRSNNARGFSVMAASARYHGQAGPWASDACKSLRHHDYRNPRFAEHHVREARDGGRNTADANRRRPIRNASLCTRDYNRVSLSPCTKPPNRALSPLASGAGHRASQIVRRPDRLTSRCTGRGAVRWPGTEVACCFGACMCQNGRRRRSPRR